jgi:hypothetical protein
VVYGSVALTVIGGIPGNEMGVVTGIPGILGAGCGKPGTRCIVFFETMIVIRLDKTFPVLWKTKMLSPSLSKPTIVNYV